VTVTRAVPEPVSLLHRDVVTAEVMERVAASGIDPAAGEVLRRLPLALAEVEGDAIRDFAGVQVDPTEGTLTLNAPDELGRVREVRRGDEVHLAWYRWTQAAAGNVGAGEIRLVEQGPSVRPRVTGATNPLPTAWGADRERDEDAVARGFGPQTGEPVTSGDWERLVRAALGRRAAGWLVRVWGYPERTLMSTALWPLPFAMVPGSGSGPAVDAERTALERALETAGPDTLLVALGPVQGGLDDDELEQARRTCQALVARWAERIPTVRRVLVTRLWPLHAVGSAPGPFPRFSLHEVRGELVDARGRRAVVPHAALLLNAAVVGCEP
jgi:hypothetical protein